NLKRWNWFGSFGFRASDFGFESRSRLCCLRAGGHGTSTCTQEDRSPTAPGSGDGSSLFEVGPASRAGPNLGWAGAARLAAPTTFGAARLAAPTHRWGR